MRLLNVDSLEFTEFRDDERPKYVIASHRWAADETSYKDVRKKRNVDRVGYKKVEAFARYIRDNVHSVKWLWIDTCCIDKKDLAELSEAINLMFDWYPRAELCIAYLADVETIEDRDSFNNSEWFRRGWTLQELLAPCTVIFVTKAWQVIGSKREKAHEIATITRIPEQVLHNYEASFSLSVAERLRWMEGRRTAREEDMSYALFGIFNVSPGVNYGEKRDRAEERLLAEIRQPDHVIADRFRKMVEWLSPPDPWINHTTARKHHTPQTGAWLPRSEQYQRWKSGPSSCLRILGKAGSGKTVMCSTAIEDIQEYCRITPNVGCAIFYFSFADKQKQSYEGLLRSLIAQLWWKDPGLSMLRQAYNRLRQRPLGVVDLQRIVALYISSYDQFFLLLDALDECPEGDGTRRNVLAYLGQLLSTVPNIRILATSRDIPDVRHSLEELINHPIFLRTDIVDPDMRGYISARLSRDRRLSKLNPATKTLIENTLSQKADGMFQWVDCQIRELKKLKSMKPKWLEEALGALPTTLDRTYEQMLTRIEEKIRPEALTLLRWTAYAKAPLSLSELAETTIIDPSADIVVDIENRGSWEDTRKILSGLITIDAIDERKVQHADHSRNDPKDFSSSEWSNRFSLSNDASDSDSRGDFEHSDTSNYPDDLSDSSDRSDGLTGKRARARLAHFSVKEYLESSRILVSSAREFHLSPAEGHRFLAQSCLAYLLHYSESTERAPIRSDLADYPLLEYAAKAWYYHSSLQQSGSVDREIALLTSERSRRAWLSIDRPEEASDSPASALYCASLVGLEAVVEQLLVSTPDVNTHGGFRGNALLAASYGGHEKVVKMLLEQGADVNAQGGAPASTLYAAT